MYSRWTLHLDDEEAKEKFRKRIRESKDVLDRLRDMISEDLNMLDRSEMDQRIYDSANWDYRQAHKNGVRQYANTMKMVTNLDQQKGTQ